jgi:hypothetical protein
LGFDFRGFPDVVLRQMEALRDNERVEAPEGMVNVHGERDFFISSLEEYGSLDLSAQRLGAILRRPPAGLEFQPTATAVFRKTSKQSSQVDHSIDEASRPRSVALRYVSYGVTAPSARLICALMICRP